MIDTGTGEIKLIAALAGEHVAFHELVSFKGDTLTCARQLQYEEETTMFDELMAAMQTGLARISRPGDDDGALRGVAAVLDDNAMLGATAWYRSAKGDDAKCALALLEAIQRKFDALCKEQGLRPRLHWEVISGEAEALHEQRAVEYAVTNSRDSNGEPLAPPLVTIAAGSGSVQVTGFEATTSFYAPLKQGEAILQGGSPFADWQLVVGEAYRRRDELMALQGLPGDLMERGEPLKSVWISGNYYAALTAGVIRKGEAPCYLSAVEARDKMLLAVQDTSHPAKERANIARLITVMDMLFGDTLQNVECLFARDWKLNGAPFRTTWTAGWWLSHLSDSAQRSA